MNFQFSNPLYLLLLPPAVVWVIWLAWKSDVQISAWRRWTAFLLRLIIVVALILAVAGLQWKRSMEGVNVFFLMDRSDSVPSAQQEASREWINKFAAQKKLVDKAGVLVFGSEASIESSVTNAVDVKKIYSVVSTERSDIAAAIRLGTAAFPESGQRRLVLFSDGNENAGNALDALMAAKPLGVSIDVVPLTVNRGNDVSVQKLTVPSTVKKGQTFDVKIFAQADEAQTATVQLIRNEQVLGEQKVELSAGKNLFTFPQTLSEPGFYSYTVQLNAPGDLIPQNNRATSFAAVRGNPRILIVSAEPQQDATLAAALQNSRLEVKVVDITGLPGTLAEMQSYDAIFLSNISAGDLGDANMKLVESAVRDFGVGLVCIGGDQTYAAGGYRGTPLESTLPVDMELNSKKVLPSGALVIVCHATEFPNGNQWARDIAFAALDALGPQDEMGIVLWDGKDRWLFDLSKVGDKKDKGRMIAGMNPGDMPDFSHVMSMANDSLKQSTANLKHMVVFSDGDPGAPTKKLVESIVGNKITISTVMIGGHVTPETMTWMAEMGHGRFYDVRSPAQLPQIFLKETAIILKSAIFEQPFKPQLAAASELVRGIGAAEYPQLKGYVCTTAKPRAEVPLVSDKGDPVLAHWQYGLGRAVAFTSDAKPKWAANWMGWDKYRQFWSQVGQWSLRKIENADFTTEISVDKGEGNISVEAVDAEGNYRNFLNLRTTVLSPKGDRQVIRLEQTGPGHYEAKFPTKEIGAYLMNLAEMKNGEPQASQVLGASVNYSPEFNSTEANFHLLNKLAEAGDGKVLDPQVDNPFLHDRKKTFQPKDLWEWLMQLAILLFPLDVAVRRVQLDRDEMARFFRRLQFWKKEKAVPQDESLTALLARRDEVRSKQPTPVIAPNPDLFRPDKPVILPEKETAKAPVSVAETAVKTGGAKPEEPASTTGRLLEAKKRAKKNLE